jgi:hypothetical protein
MCNQIFSALARLVLESSILLVAFFAVLLFAAGQKSFYLDLLSGLKDPSSDAEHVSESARIRKRGI